MSTHPMGEQRAPRRAGRPAAVASYMAAQELAAAEMSTVPEQLLLL
jgi:hypothetical protein